MEATLTVGLIAIGLPKESPRRRAAVSAPSTLWLPVLPGWLAFDRTRQGRCRGRRGTDSPCPERSPGDDATMASPPASSRARAPPP
ncbi:hypothetical protein SALBM311S_04682 [Streptomyces alboniger]